MQSVSPSSPQDPRNSPVTGIPYSPKWLSFADPLYVGEWRRPYLIMALLMQISCSSCILRSPAIYGEWGNRTGARVMRSRVCGGAGPVYVTA